MDDLVDLMNLFGFGAEYAILMALPFFTIKEFFEVNLLIDPFNPVGALLLTLMVNARHLFYGIYAGKNLKEQALRRCI
ncbi:MULTISPECIES: hypothetical protein [Paenibacillus]|uniref:hypothetical protein n=1 Tax=Paenibacillus TaxID=44249 RepID=UPI0016235E35|nr:hypothetical protein [Paenibacillus polymyxa]KAF6583820.1 hypothetical protein G9G57_10440 [Paenibacillus sp. EKM211P]